MKRLIKIVGAMVLLFILATKANSATSVYFGSNITVDEGAGVVWIQVKRSGDLSITSAVSFNELWSDNSTTTSKDEILYNPHSAPANVKLYSNADRFGSVVFNAGQSVVKIPYSITNDKLDESSERLYFQLKSPSTGTTIKSPSTMYIKVNDNDATLSLNGGLLVEEGDSSTSYVKLSKSISTDVTFKVSTYKGTYGEANVKGSGGDYLGLIDKSFTIKAGDTKVSIPVLTYQNTDSADAEYESTQLCIESTTVPSTVTLGTKCDVITIHDVPAAVTPPVDPLPVEPPPVVLTPIIATDLTGYQNIFNDMESKIGTSTTAKVIQADNSLLKTAKTLSVFGMLKQKLKDSLNFGLVAEASTLKELPTSAEVEEDFLNGLAKKTRVEGQAGFWETAYVATTQALLANRPVNWESYEADYYTSQFGYREYLRIGDYVEGRLVVEQPWVAFSPEGNLMTTNSLQGRFLDGDVMTSHKNLLLNSFDWSASTDPFKYVIAVADGTVEYINYSYSVGKDIYGVHGLGNIITIKLNKTDFDGWPIYVTYAHLEQQTKLVMLKVGDKVKSGQVLGLIGNTGGWYEEGIWKQFPKHIHVTVGTKINVDLKNVAESKDDVVPPVYMLGFDPDKVASTGALGGNSYITQDIGFPMGDSAWPHVADGIIPTILDPKLHLSKTVIYPHFLQPKTDLPKIHGTEGKDNPLKGTGATDAIYGYGGDDVFVPTTGNDIYYGGDGYDFISYSGSQANRSKFKVTPDFNGNIIVQSEAFGTEIYSGIEGVWFDNDGTDGWYDLKRLLATEPDLNGMTFIGTTDWDVFVGTVGSDSFTPRKKVVTDSNDVVTSVIDGAFVATDTLGNDYYNGGPNYDQVNFTGPDSYKSDFTVTRKSNDTVVVQSPTSGTDTLLNIDGIWFDAEAKWYSIAELVQ